MQASGLSPQEGLPGGGRRVVGRGRAVVVGWGRIVMRVLIVRVIIVRVGTGGNGNVTVTRRVLVETRRVLVVTRRVLVLTRGVVVTTGPGAEVVPQTPEKQARSPSQSSSVSQGSPKTGRVSDSGVSSSTLVGTTTYQHSDRSRRSRERRTASAQPSHRWSWSRQQEESDRPPWHWPAGWRTCPGCR